MKKCVEKIFIGIICFSLFFSNVSISANAGGATAAKVLPVLLEMGKEIVVAGAGHAIENLVDTWFSGEKEYYDSPGEKTTMDYYANNSAVNKATGSISNSGANNENCYNTFSSTVTDKRTYSLIKDSYNATTNNYTTMLYNPITNNYTELNQTSNIYYNNQYDTYYIENNEYNYYVTNNYTYVSYYIINNETNEESYYEIYYELPDGRNSYDLEKEDIWGEYFIYDVVGYESVQEDDGKTLFLYHLDGDGKDSSYWKNSDMPLSSGNFYNGKFGLGLLINTGIGIRLPNSFDYNNFTLEFTILSGERGSSQYFNFFGESHWDVNYPANSVLSYVVQSVNGVVSIYENGAFVGNPIHNDYSSYVYLSFFRFLKNSDGTYSIGFYPVYSGVSYILDEIRLSNCPLYSGNSISVPTQAFDTNQVLVLPENPTENMIAVQGKYGVSDFRVGGVRPTYPTKGFVYIYLEDDVVKDIQQYEGDAWYSVNGAIYMDGEWSDLSGCNLSTLRFEEKTPDDDSGGDSDNSSGDSDNDSNDDSGSGSVSGNGTGSSGSGISDLLGGIGKIFDTLLSLIGKLMGIVADFTESVLNLFTGFTTFTDGFTGFLSESFTFIPAEIWNLIALGLSLAILCAVINFLRK